MSDIFLYKLTNDEINFEEFKKWILSQDSNLMFKCSQTEFLTYFLNFIHEEINISQRKFSSTSHKCTPRKIRPNVNEKQSPRKNSNVLDKASTFPLSSVKSLEKSFGEFSCNSNTSTPKNSKIHSASELNESYYSPVSPLYKEQHVGTPKNKRHAVCLGDYLIQKSSKKKASIQKINNDSNKRITPTSLNHLESKESVKSSIQKINDDSNRRITPTSLSHLESKEPFKSSNSFNNFNTKEISYNDDRMFLAKERLKILSRNNPVDNSVSTTSRRMSLSEQRDQVEPQMNLVTYKSQLKVLSDIYSLILKNNLVLNITGEIYFLVSLLVIKQYVADSTEESHSGISFLNNDEEFEMNSTKCKVSSNSDYFETIHNIIYFAMKSLQTQFDVLKYYDKPTLKLLSSNKRLKEFCVKFSEKLKRLSEKRPERVIEIYESRSNVGYNLDTDTKNNFPSEVSFLALRKQRDLFYEILRIWEKNHLLAGWNFQIGLGGKIKSLLTLQAEPTNFMHLARLFKAQLLSSYGISAVEDELTEESLFPSNFPNVDPSKLSRLKNRFVTRQSSNDLNSPPSFIGYQEFYKEFIVVAANHCFNVHLRDSFVSEIIELNGKKFNVAGLEESDTEVDAATRKSYAINVRHLRVLAKFLGFLECLPYKSESNNYPENMFNSHLKIREQKTPCLDVKRLLLSSIKDNAVVLTVPWLVKYLSMLDYITLRLPYFTSMYETLFQLYHSYEKPSKHAAPDYNNALVKFCLGWLFDLPHFPDTEYARFCASKNAHFIRKPKTLDDVVIVDQNILYFCCPYLEEIKRMLTNSFENCGTVTVKHITPVTAAESSEHISKKRLEQQLEEAFFNGQPESVKKTVEFVSERLASACVKHICTTLVPPFKKDASKRIKDFLDSQKQELQVMSPGKERNQKTILRIKITQLAQENLSTLHQKCASELSAILSERLPTTIENLLAVDTLPQTRTICISIASRMCRERLKQWINSHVTLSIFMKDFEKELHKMLTSENRKHVEEKVAFALPSSGRRDNHNERSLSAFHLLEKIKSFSLDILRNSTNLDKHIIVHMVNEGYETLTTRCDVNDVITASICNSLVDLALLLVAHHPNVMQQDDVLESFAKVWRWYSKCKDDLFKDLLCPKNVTLLNQSEDRKTTWTNFAGFVAYLIKENILLCDNFENQCYAFFRKEWEQNVLNDVCYFMNQFVECYKQNGARVNEFTMLLEFLADFCTEMEP